MIDWNSVGGVGSHFGLIKESDSHEERSVLSFLEIKMMYFRHNFWGIMHQQNIATAQCDKNAHWWNVSRVSSICISFGVHMNVLWRLTQESSEPSLSIPMLMLKRKEVQLCTGRVSNVANWNKWVIGDRCPCETLLVAAWEAIEANRCKNGLNSQLYRRLSTFTTAWAQERDR